MRVLVLCIVLALSLAIHGVEGNQLCLSQSNSPIDTYKSFIRKLRQEFTFGFIDRSGGIPILMHSLPDSKRFQFINLTSENDETIVLAIDASDVGVAAYRTSYESYFFPNAPQVAFQILFTDTHQNIMSFNNTFESIEKAAGTTRSETPLGDNRLELAISNLFHHRHELVPVSFLVIIQMVIEATKFRFIEQSVVNSMRDGKNNFTPGLAILSLEDNWSELSLQLQASTTLQGLFGNAILLYNSNNEPIEVDSIHYPIVISNIAYQLYRCPVTMRKGSNFIRMPSDEGGDIQSNNDQCSIQSHTTRISGREGLCVDVAGALVDDGSRVILYPCGQQVNQKWTIHQDYTIRSLGKCLASNTSSFGNSIVIYDCNKAGWEDIEWEISDYGRIMSEFSDLVLAANAAERGTNLTAEDNTFDATQAWRVGNYVEPIIASIIGLKEMCLEATNENTNMWLENCVKNKAEQYWVLYSDGTIRVNNNRSLCVTTSIDNSSNVITICGCNGSTNQRWDFMRDGTISQTKNEWRMDVAQNDVSLKQVILRPKNRQTNQQWTLFY